MLTIPAAVQDGIRVSTYDETAQFLKNTKNGRFTIRGDNGAGKSTLLNVLKGKLADDALLIPSHHGRLCWQQCVSEMSTGQRTLKQLHEAFDLPATKYLLLDEWDANLDDENRRTVNERL